MSRRAAAPYLPSLTFPVARLYREFIGKGDWLMNGHSFSRLLGTTAVVLIVFVGASPNRSDAAANRTAKCAAKQAMLASKLSQCLVAELAKKTQQEGEVSLIEIRRCEDRFLTRWDQLDGRYGRDCARSGDPRQIIRQAQEGLGLVASMVTDCPSVTGRWRGTLSGDLSGTWDSRTTQFGTVFESVGVITLNGVDFTLTATGTVGCRNGSFTITDPIFQSSSDFDLDGGLVTGTWSVGSLTGTSEGRKVEAESCEEETYTSSSAVCGEGINCRCRDKQISNEWGGDSCSVNSDTGSCFAGSDSPFDSPSCCSCSAKAPSGARTVAICGSSPCTCPGIALVEIDNISDRAACRVTADSGECSRIGSGGCCVCAVGP